MVSSTGARFGANLTSAISAQGKLRFMLTKGRVTAAVLSSSSGDCWSTRGSDRVKLIDGHPTHRAKSVARFVAEQAGMLGAVLPAARFTGAEPHKYVWNELKSQCTWCRVINSLTQLRQMIVSDIRRLQKLPMLVRSFFHRPQHAVRTLEW